MKPAHTWCISLTDSSKVSFLTVNRSIILVSILLVASIAVSIYFGSFKPKAIRASIVSSPLVFSIELNKAEFIQQGERVNITFSLINTSNKTLTLEWSSFFVAFDQRFYFDFYIVDANGTRIYQMSRGYGRGMANASEVVGIGERLTNFYEWPQVYSGRTGYDAIVPKGTYSVVGLTRGMTISVDSQRSGIMLETPSVTFTIK